MQRQNRKTVKGAKDPTSHSFTLWIVLTALHFVFLNNSQSQLYHSISTREEKNKPTFNKHISTILTLDVLKAYKKSQQEKISLASEEGDEKLLCFLLFQATNDTTFADIVYRKANPRTA